ncbi:uncharacterized protein F4812DRAFT_11528 [Daldinia caldariorum]|uniref:uncharacterized protein n=1 Tax=Daldinia caldariorum TaxID=326644 RepID=UPI002007BDC4|nr:uncharacterized protein F4812DRAFT_11528 [Daldinia caldariorum]KAI1472393.1 hypothetical protein F4812DRAFT_11528 [Daldinia caldariorum]
MSHRPDLIHPLNTPPLPFPPPPFPNVPDSQSVEEQWNQYIRNRQTKTTEDGTSDTVEQQNRHRGQCLGWSTAIQHPTPIRFQTHKLLDAQDHLAVMGFLTDDTRGHKPSVYHGPEASSHQYSERDCFESVRLSSSSLGRSDSSRSVETPIPSYRAARISFHGLLTTISRKFHALTTATTTDATTQIPPSNNSSDTYIGSNDHASGSASGI